MQLLILSTEKYQEGVKTRILQLMNIYGFGLEEIVKDMKIHMKFSIDEKEKDYVQKTIGLVGPIMYQKQENQ